MDGKREYGNLDAALAKWDEGKSVWSIEMGGIGPGYEQAIQIGIFELSKLLMKAVPPPDDSKVDDWLTQTLYATIKASEPALDGLSGAQAHAIMSVAYQFWKHGYEETLNSVEDDRRILVSRSAPSLKERA